MPKCPNCGSTAQVRKWMDSLEKPDTRSFYFCGCGECFVAEDPQKQKEKFLQRNAKKHLTTGQSCVIISVQGKGSVLSPKDADVC